MKRFACFILLTWSLSVFAQQPAGAERFQIPAGCYTVQQFADNICKVTFKPNDYLRNENPSDAVILQPGFQGKHKAGLKNDTLFFAGDGLKLVYHQDSAARGFRFLLKFDEKIFGGGERALPLNRRGYRLDVYNTARYGYAEGADNLHYSIPFISSSNGYALFFDNPSRSFIDIGKSNRNVLEYGASSDELNVYVIFGDYQSQLQTYYKLTGTQPLPPRWALGNFMSRFGYASEAQVKGILQKMQKDSIPVDAIIFDLFWFGDSVLHTMGNLEWMNRQAWPDPKKMITDFKKQGIQTILVTEPFFVQGSINYKASKKYLAVDSTGKPYYLTNFFFGNGGLIDIFRKDAQQWFWQFYKKQIQNGVQGWWGDLGEPEKHPSDIYHNLKDLDFKRLFSADEVHNIYGHTWTKMLYNYYAKEYPNTRLFSLNRSGFAGSQRYAIFPWTGDVSRSWSGLRSQLPVLLGASMSGIPYVHSDAGGFAGGEGDSELYVRWLQFAAFTPVFRPHGTALYEKDTTAFSFPSEAALIDEPYRTYAKNAVLMRYLLLPYNYSLAYQQTVSGKPLMAPLYYYFPGDTTASKVEDEYMWGENLLVAPVIEKGVAEKQVYLPAGKWKNIFNFRIYDGGRWISTPTDMNYIPVFEKEGAFVPTVSQIRNVSEYLVKGQYVLNFFPSKSKTCFTWFEDDGVSKNSLATKSFSLIQCTGQDLGNKIVVEIRPSNKRFVPKTIAVQISVDKKPEAVTVNGRLVPLLNSPSKPSDASRELAVWMPEVSAVQVYIHFPNGQPATIKLKK